MLLISHCIAKLITLVVIATSSPLFQVLQLPSSAIAYLTQDRAAAKIKLGGWGTPTANFTPCELRS